MSPILRLCNLVASLLGNQSPFYEECNLTNGMNQNFERDNSDDTTELIFWGLSTKVSKSHISSEWTINKHWRFEKWSAASPVTRLTPERRSCRHHQWCCRTWCQSQDISQSIPSQLDLWGRPARWETCTQTWSDSQPTGLKTQTLYFPATSMINQVLQGQEYTPEQRALEYVVRQTILTINYKDQKGCHCTHQMWHGRF